MPQVSLQRIHSNASFQSWGDDQSLHGIDGSDDMVSQIFFVDCDTFLVAKCKSVGPSVRHAPLKKKSNTRIGRGSALLNFAFVLFLLKIESTLISFVSLRLQSQVPLSPLTSPSNLPNSISDYVAVNAFRQDSIQSLSTGEFTVLVLDQYEIL